MSHPVGRFTGRVHKHSSHRDTNVRKKTATNTERTQATKTQLRKHKSGFISYYNT